MFSHIIIFFSSSLIFLDAIRFGHPFSLFSMMKVMESLEHALKRDAPIFAEYLGGGVTCDAHHMTDPRADGLGVSTCIINALKDGGISSEEVHTHTHTHIYI
mgnify:CR=1 FL=1